MALMKESMAMPVLLHGDAAFIGQGSVAESLQLAELAGGGEPGWLPVKKEGRAISLLTRDLSWRESRGLRRKEGKKREPIR